jgi:hypothetical protein
MVGCTLRTSSRIGHYGGSTKRMVQTRGGYPPVNMFFKKAMGSQEEVWGMHSIYEGPGCASRKALYPPSSQVFFLGR